MSAACLRAQAGVDREGSGVIGRLSQGARSFVSRIGSGYNALGRSHSCYICGRSFRKFRPFRNGWKDVSPFALKLQVVGSDVEHFSCAFCGCTDRERHLVMYFDRLGLWSRIPGCDVLHFAPEHHLQSRIAERSPAHYVKADLFPSDADWQRVDVTQIAFGDASFDIIICNHVLEHVVEDARALHELFRVLRPGGCAILQTPHSALLHDSFCDAGINTDELRNYFYCQEDHVRLYGRDLFTRITQAGFGLQVKTHVDVLADIDAVYYGVNPRENLILAVKEP